MSDEEHTSYLTSQEDYTNSLPHTLAAECTSSSPPVLDYSQPEQPQHLSEASPRSDPSHSDSEWTLSLNKRAADEDCDSDRDDISQSCFDSDNSQLDMMTSPEHVRKQLKKDYMFIDKGYLNDSGNADFKKMVMKVMEIDRTSAVSKKDKVRFEKNYKKYKYFNEVTFIYMLLPTMIGDEFTAQDVNKDG
ncbi:MAG: hypothetical protein L6R36_006815 [Xanthoria steineri]|nr:MAG: hypothetical protein L6R36_008059 [Xanthoria steineri]KAI4221562.1 MAG: hypothetical protein L6R36_006815 [Xanthoria steineri]